MYKRGAVIVGKLVASDPKITKEIAIGIAGNWCQESMCNPKAEEKPGLAKGGKGLCQWTAERRIEGERFMQQKFGVKNIQSANVDQQLSYFLYENSGPEKYHWNKFLKAVNNTTNIDIITAAFCNIVERPGKPMLSHRIGFARDIARIYDPTIPVSSVAIFDNTTLTSFSNVFSDSEYTGHQLSTSGNAVQTLFLGNSIDTSASEDSNKLVPPPRIYQAFSPTIVADELSMSFQNADGNFSRIPNNSTVDSSSNSIVGDTSDKNSTIRDNSGLTDNDINNGNNPPGLGTNQIYGKGFYCPVLRINDHYFAKNEITYFELETKNFLPTIIVKIQTSLKDLNKGNLIKDGDKCAVYINTDLDNKIKSLRADFLITNVVESPISQEVNSQQYEYTIFGELYVPNIHNDSMCNFTFAGSSRDALMNMAQTLGLGFFFNDPDDTNDTQMWSSMPSGDGPETYIIDVASHAWKDNSYFYNCWIDPRYALTFLNVNEILGVDGPDQGMDLTKFTSTVLNNMSIDGKNSQSLNKLYHLKIFNNVVDTDQFTPYFVLNYEIINQAAEITKQIGLNVQSYVDVNNEGLDEENTSVDIQSQLVLNDWKLQNGFYALTGPGENITYAQADNGNYSDQQLKKSAETIQDTMSSGDAQVIAETGSNEFASGNVAATYEMAATHNMINNMQLEKMYMNLEVAGANLGIMRGEKVPVVIVERSPFAKIQDEGEETTKETMNDKENSSADDIDITASGWFMIDAIKYVYNPYAHHITSNANYWTTKVKLTRREWPNPLPNKSPEDSSVLTVNRMTTNEGAVEASAESSLDSSANVGNGTSYEGLVPYMNELISLMNETIENSFKVVSGRRYAVDANGNKYDGNAFLKKGNLYKCVSSTGQELWFSSNNSKHLYGEAIDIINSDCSFEELGNKILSSNQILLFMYNHGLSMFIESTTDDMGVSVKHYHIGTDTVARQAFWNQVYSTRGTWLIGSKSVADYNSINVAQKEIKNAIQTA